MHPDTWRNIVFLGAPILLLAVIVAGIVNAYGVWGHVLDRLDRDDFSCETFEFSAEEWQDWEGDGDETNRVTPRERMARGLVRCGTLIGSTRAEVRRQLGRAHPTARRDRYLAGWAGGYVGGQWHLIVVYDPRGRVSAVRQERPGLD